MTAESIGIKLMTLGWVQAHIDLFYLTNTNERIKVPSSIEYGEAYSSAYTMNKKRKVRFE